MEKPPFEPNGAEYSEWLRAIPEEQRLRYALFLASAESRNIAGRIADEQIFSMTREATYLAVSRTVGCSVKSIQKRVTRHRDRTGWSAPPSHREVPGEPHTSHGDQGT